MWAVECSKSELTWANLQCVCQGRRMTWKAERKKWVGKRREALTWQGQQIFFFDNIFSEVSTYKASFFYVHKVVLRPWGPTQLLKGGLIVKVQLIPCTKICRHHRDCQQEWQQYLLGSSGGNTHHATSPGTGCGAGHRVHRLNLFLWLNQVHRDTGAGGNKRWCNPHRSAVPQWAKHRGLCSSLPAAERHLSTLLWESVCKLKMLKIISLLMFNVDCLSEIRWNKLVHVFSIPSFYWLARICMLSRAQNLTATAEDNYKLPFLWCYDVIKHV